MAKKYKNTMLFLCDFQEGYSDLPFFNEIVENGHKLLKEAERLGVDIAITELRGMGDTASGLGAEKPKYRPHVKKPLSMLGPDLKDYVIAKGMTSVILCGMEAHRAIKETAKDLRGLGMKVFIVVDACCSKHKVDRQSSFDYFSSIGCSLVTTELAFDPLVTGTKEPKPRSSIFEEPSSFARRQRASQQLDIGAARGSEGSDWLTPTRNPYTGLRASGPGRPLTVVPRQRGPNPGHRAEEPSSSNAENGELAPEELEERMNDLCRIA